MYWWAELGYPDAFDVGRDGFFPRPGQVVKYYRERKMNDKGKAWTQKNLAKTLGITDSTVREIENRDIGMDFDRRQFLSKLFGIPPLLLGIMTPDEITGLLEQQRKVNSNAVLSTDGATSHKHTIDVKQYQERLAGLWGTFLSSALHTAMAVAVASVDELQRELLQATQERPHLQELLRDYHVFLSALRSEQGQHDEAVGHLNQAFRFTVGDEQTARIFYNRGAVLWKADRIDEAVYDFEQAWCLEKKLPNNLRGIILLESGRARAQQATTRQERTAILRSIDSVGSIIRADHQEQDPHLLRLDLDCYHLYKGAALIGIGWNKEANEELNLINGFPDYRLRQVYYDILQAQAYTNRGMYEVAAQLLEFALTSAQEVNSAINIARIVNVFQQLQQSLYKDSPDVARIDYLLYQRPRVQKP